MPFFFPPVLLPFFSSCPITDAASVRDCGSVGLVRPARTFDASVEVLGVDCFLATVLLLRLKAQSFDWVGWGTY